MVKQHSAVDLGLRVLDLLVLAISFPIAYFLRQHFFAPVWGPALAIEHYWPTLSVALLLWIVTSPALEVYDSFRTRSVIAEVGRIGRALAVVGFSVAALGFLSKHDVSRLLVGLFFAVALGALALTRVAMRSLAHEVRRRGYNTRTYAVVGSGEAAAEVVASIEQHPEWGMQFGGYIVDPGDPPVPEAEQLGRLSDLGAILDTVVLDEVIFAVSRERLAAIDAAVQLCSEQGVPVRICLDVFRRSPGRVAIGQLDGLPMLALSRTPSDPVALAIKRVFDVAVSGLLLLLLSPFIAAIAAAIKLDSPGPVFFRQRRVGLNGRAFTMLKFRSMHSDAEQRLEALRGFNRMSGPVFKMANDPRVTRAGRLLRRTSLDELPQFWNVLSGAMSVVGPRPPLPSEVKQYRRWQRRRLSVKPGITCTWQVSGRSDIDFDRWMELDLDYIDHWSLWRDLQICLKTIPAVLTTRGAH